MRCTKISEIVDLVTMVLQMEISPNDRGTKLQGCSTHLSSADLPAKLTYIPDAGILQNFSLML